MCNLLIVFYFGDGVIFNLSKNRHIYFLAYLEIDFYRYLFSWECMFCCVLAMLIKMMMMVMLIKMM